MTAPLVRDHHADHFPGDNDDPRAEAARRALRDALAAFLPATPACTDDPDAWFGDGADHRGSARRIADAIAACGPCPIRPECGEAGRYERWGVWGAVPRGVGTHPERQRHQDVPARRRPLGRLSPPVVCPSCRSAPGEVCTTAAGTLAHSSHRERSRLAARKAAA
jgi:hypothetical protein